MKLKEFYDREYEKNDYCPPSKPDEHPRYKELSHFVEQYELRNKCCLEVGCGRGAFQDSVKDYTGVDVSGTVQKYIHKPFYQASATELPFANDTFDALWTITVLEHVPNPEKALHEFRRVLKPGGLLLLAPSWQCRSWAAEGYPVRPYSDFGFKGKLVKASIPLRNSVLYRSMFIFPHRAIRYMQWLMHKRPVNFKYTELKPNYEHFWMSDSDAVNAMDPYEAILWFKSRGDECLTYPTGLSQFFVRTLGIVFRINKGDK